MPNIFIGGNHLGGCSDLKAKVSKGEIKKLLTDAGVENAFWESSSSSYKLHTLINLFKIG